MVCSKNVSVLKEKSEKRLSRGLQTSSTNDFGEKRNIKQPTPIGLNKENSQMLWDENALRWKPYWECKGLDALHEEKSGKTPNKVIKLIEFQTVFDADFNIVRLTALKNINLTTIISNAGRLHQIVRIPCKLLTILHCA